MGQHNSQQRRVQIQKSKSEPQSSSPATKQIKATVIGFSREDCKICFGRGRLGFDARFKDKTHIIACRCVEFFDLETVQKSWEEARQENERRVKAELSKLDQNSPLEEFIYPCGIHGTAAAGMPRICPEHGELCGTESQSMQSSSSSHSESSNSSSSVSGSTST
jgi:hypothetical protein